jgi:hypothetical protein
MGWGSLFCQKKVSEQSEFFFQRKGTPTPWPGTRVQAAQLRGITRSRTNTIRIAASVSTGQDPDCM